LKAKRWKTKRRKRRTMDVSVSEREGVLGRLRSVGN
jgi:hypothetical protein